MIYLEGLGKLHGAGDYCEGLERIVAFSQKDMGGDRIPVQETTTSKQREATK